MEENDRLHNMLVENRIDLNKNYVEPTAFVMMKASGYNRYVRVFTPGNLSSITGKAKSKKTFLQTMIIASAVNNVRIFENINAFMPSDKRNIVCIDTEQSVFDVARVGDRIKKLTNTIPENLFLYSMMGEEPKIIFDFIEYIFQSIPNIGILFIDQVADLVYSINDEAEANIVIKKLQMLAREYNCHISCVIHQNKANDFATGHIGSMIMKKSETVMAVSKNAVDNTSTVAPSELRNREFEEFTFIINDDGLPEITTIPIVSM